MSQTGDNRLIRSRDILTVSATLIGFIITTFGLLLTQVERDSETFTPIIQNYTGIVILVLIAFFISVAFTILFNISHSSTHWNIALFSFFLGWIWLGLIIVYVFVGYSLQLENIQIQLPDFDFD